MMVNGATSRRNLVPPPSKEYLDTHSPPDNCAQWPVPVDFLADSDATGVPELQPDHLPAAVAPFVFDTASRMGVDPAAVALSAIVSLSSVMSDEWHLQPKQHDTTWTEQPRLWGAIVGDPSILKSPVIATTTRPIVKLEMEARRIHEEDMRRYKAELKRWKDSDSDPETEPKLPRLPRYMVEDTTVDALTEVLRSDSEAKQHAPSGKVLVRRDELSEWLASFGRYRSGGSAGADRGAYIRLYNGEPYAVDRLGRGHFVIGNWSGSVLGGIQPGPIQRIARDADDDGLLQRFCYIVPNGQRRGEDRKPDLGASQRYETLFSILANLVPLNVHNGGSGRVVLNADAHQVRAEILNLAEAMAAMPDTSARLKAAFGKWPGQWVRLTLIFHLIEVASARAELRSAIVGNVERGVATMATKFMRDILLPHLLRAEEIMFSTTRTGHARWIAGYILSKDLERVTVRDVVQNYRALRPTDQRRELLEIMDSLELMGWVRPELKGDGRSPVAWRVNPMVHSVFTERAEREKAQRQAAQERIRETVARLHGRLE